MRENVLSQIFSFVPMALAVPSTSVERRAISQDVMDDLTWYIQFASGADQIYCTAPAGTTLIQTVMP